MMCHCMERLMLLSRFLDVICTDSIDFYRVKVFCFISGIVRRLELIDMGKVPGFAVLHLIIGASGM